MISRAPRWGFRISSRPESGAGHLSRCLALADALAGDVTLFLDPTGPDPAFVSRLTMPMLREDAPHQCDGLLAALQNGQVQAALVDSYAIESSAVFRLSEHAFTVSIDDNQGTVSGQLSIRPGFIAQDASAEMKNARVVGGVQYALLDKSFAAAPVSRRVRADRPRMLLSFGARDSKNATSLVLQALIGEFINMKSITVVLGDAAPHRADLVRQYANVPMVSFAAPSHASVMRVLCDEHDFYVGAGGVGLLERMAAGLPGIVVSTADNQDANASEAVKAGAAISGGSLQDFEPCAFRALVSKTMRDQSKLADVASRARALIDGRGCERVAKVMMSEYQNWRERHVSL